MFQYAAVWQCVLLHRVVSQCAAMCHSVLPYVAVIICHTKQVYFVSGDHVCMRLYVCVCV